MTAEVEFTAAYEEVEGGWVQARLVEIPGVITVAPTREEAEEAPIDAFAEHVRSFAGTSVPRAEGTAVNVTVTAA